MGPVALSVDSASSGEVRGPEDSMEQTKSWAVWLELDVNEKGVSQKQAGQFTTGSREFPLLFSAVTAVITKSHAGGGEDFQPTSGILRGDRRNCCP